MDIAGKARKLERRISRSVEAAVDEFMGKSATAPIEIVHRVLDRAEAEIQDIGRGRRVFPFNRVRVHVLAAAGDKESRARFAAVADGPPSLAERLTERLQSAGCAASRVATEIVYARRRDAAWQEADYHVEFDRVALPDEPPAAPVVEPAVVRLKLAVLKGSAEQRAYAFTAGRIDIGRRSEVVDRRQHVIRTNHVAFSEEGSEANKTVSRRHAHIEFSPPDRCYRIWDDHSAHGTSIVRRGRTIKVPAGARGTRLETDDEISLGEARLRVTIDTKKEK